MDGICFPKHFSLFGDSFTFDIENDLISNSERRNGRWKGEILAECCKSGETTQFKLCKAASSSKQQIYSKPSMEGFEGGNE